MKTPIHTLILFLVSAFLLPCNPANAAAREIAKITLCPEKISAKSGMPFTLEAIVEIADGWHIYSPDNKTFPTRITPNLPEGFVLEGQTWPTPVKFKAFGEELSGYEKSVKILLNIKGQTADDSSAPLRREISATLNALACKDVCVPQKLASNTVEVEIVRADKTGGLELLFAMAGAFIGGMLLNLMPCVFPVLAIKIMSFAKDAAKGRGGAFVSSLWYAAGIEVSFAAVAAVLIALKAGGAALGWGFQLQNPVFVGCMAVLFTAICMNFAGFFEVGLSMQKAEGKFGGGAFASGVLAVLVASPCTAPFMGTAVGSALAADADFFEAQAIFLSIGLGMALPYVLFSVFPRALKMLPKSGAWLGIFKKVLSLPMLATAAWLCWIYSNQTQNVLPVLLAVLFTAAACAVYGAFCAPFNKAKTRIKGGIFACALAFAAMASLLAGTPSFQSDNTPPAPDAQKAQMQWSAENVERLLNDGKNVFVDFTAEWCLTCKYNERILKSGEIRRLMERKNTVFLEADWTNRNAAITKALEKFGRAGVPLYVIYPHKTPKEPQILPSILTENALKNALENLEE